MSAGRPAASSEPFPVGAAAAPRSARAVQIFMKILMAVLWMQTGGMETVVARLTRGLLRRGHDVRIVCTEEIGEIGQALIRDEVAVDFVPARGVVALVRPNALTAYFRSQAPDVVHVHSGVWLKAALAARAAGAARVVHTIHGLLDREPWYGPALMRLAAARTDAITAVSIPLAMYLRERVGIDEGRIVVVPNGIDTEAFHPGVHTRRLRDRLGWSDDVCVIGQVARFALVKNHRLLLEAFARIASRRNVALALVGDGPLRRETEIRAKELGIHERVGFLGEIEAQPAVYRDFDIFVSSSLAEGTSISLLEAMATGLPIAATNVGGSPDLLEHGRAGLLVPSEDVAAMTDGLLRLIDGEALREELGHAARLRAVASYSEERTLDRFEAVYSDGRVPARRLA